MYLFISHSSINADVAEKVCSCLEENGHKCFLAPRDIRTGHEYAEEIIAGIERSDAMLLLLSAEANESPHVLREVERAVSKHIPIMVYKMEEVQLTKSLEYFLMTHQWVNAKPGVNYDEVLKAVEELADKQDNSTVEKSTPVDVPEVKPGKNGKSHRAKRICLSLAAAFAVILLCVGVVLNKKKPLEVEPGDTLLFGTYNGETIAWRVLEVSENGREALVVSRDILCMKAFDAAESGRYNYNGEEEYWGKDISGESEELQRLLRGDNRWESSNIRTWLNATAENVKYQNGAPVAKAMSSMVNGYDSEAGFLSGFSEEELNAVLVSDVETDGVITKDKVFLLSEAELDWFESADVTLYAEPTEAACEQDKADWYEGYALELGVKDFCWWLRDGSKEDACKVYLVGNSYVQGAVSCENAGLEGYGIRPALRLDLSCGCVTMEE